MYPFLLLAVLAQSPATSPGTDAFSRTARPMLAGTCTLCHNERSAAGNLNLRPLLAPSSLVDGRETWEKVLHKLRSGEMPPPEIPRPPQAQIDALTKYLEAEFDR